MSCDVTLLDSLVHGELSPHEAASAATHVASCAECALQLRYLSAEREAFLRRSNVRPPLSHVRKGMLDALRSQQNRGPRFGLVGALAFSLCVLVVSLLPGSPVNQTRGGEETAPGFCAAPYAAMCEDVPQGPVLTRALHSGGELVAEAEDGFHACLVASPLQGSGRQDACE
ncbi:MAG: hypothetical protein ACJ790_18810 [Myxococcaceae bacterium]